MRSLRAALALAFTIGIAACQGGDGARALSDARADAATTGAGRDVDLIGAGATFPYPLYARWFNAYALRTGVQINYQSIGSGGGIRQLTAGTVDFGATDVPMTDEEIASFERGPVLHIPTVLGAVAITYNLPGVSDALRLSGDVVADIFLGRITRWDDERLRALNPTLALPDRDILVTHRSDGSGTSYIMSDYLTSVSADWAVGPGRSKDVRWPVGLGGKGNEGVAGQVKAMPGSIGYVEATYARQNRLPIALLRNARGEFTRPLAKEMDAAATAVIEREGESSDLRVSLTNVDAPDAYPLASFTWMLIAPEHLGPAKTAQLAAFLRWALTEGEQPARQLGYEPLPPEIVVRILQRLARIAPPAP